MFIQLFCLTALDNTRALCENFLASSLLLYSYQQEAVKLESAIAEAKALLTEKSLDLRVTLK